jgi:arylsulfatase A-like enzyme
VLDDVGFGAMSCYGGPIETPNIDRIAAQGVRYTQWHTTALCSPTRSCLLTGRNHTRNSMACITEAASGFPNASGTIPPENGMVSEIISERGWNTYHVGKWHLCPEAEMNVASPRRNWPTGRGFERFYGFLGAETNQWYPDLIYDNHPVDQPRLYYAPAASHAPHHAPKEWIEKFRGRFDIGYEAIREQTLARQKELGIVPPETDLPPVNPIGTLESHTDPAKPFPELDTTKPWDSLSEDEKRLFCRMAEVYAGFLAHADHHIGRILDYLQETGQLDNTLVILVSDNGASGEGVLFAHGSRFGGHALYVKDNRLHYVYNFVGSLEQKIDATEDIPTGENVILSASFDKEGEDPPGVANGILSLYYGDKKVGEGRIKTQPGKFSIAGEGLCVGRDSGEPVTDDYPGGAPWGFTGGTIRQVQVNVSGRPHVDLEREAVAMMARE